MTSKYEILFWSHATTTPWITPGGGGTQHSSIQGGSAWGPIPYPLKYRKIPKISPGAYIFQRPFLRGLFLEGPILGKAYVRREICIIKSAGLACSGNEIYHFCFVLLCTRGQILSTSPPGDLYSDRRFNRGFLCYDFGGLIFAGAYTWRASFSGFYRIILTEKVPLSSTFFLQNMVPLSHT